MSYFRCPQCLQVMPFQGGKEPERCGECHSHQMPTGDFADMVSQAAADGKSSRMLSMDRLHRRAYRKQWSKL